jgi:hypothetical protein
MALHPTTFEYLKPTPAQIEDMGVLRAAALQYAADVEHMLPDGPDKTYALRKFREVAMWVNIAITRMPDGTARD